jgi:pimeloyl-ACP methyl ester carboxylesterase
LAVWEGELREDVIEGEFGQGGVSGTFRLEPASVPVDSVSEDLPYRQEEVVFQNGDITLAGTLTIPDSPGPHPSAVMITGSGAQNRDEELVGFKFFGVIADHLTRNGIAVLRNDDRGVGGSSGDVLDATLHDTADDVLAAVNLLLKHPDIDPAQIGLIGHSEGGVVAPLVATQSPDIAFTVLLSGSGVPGGDILRSQLVLIMKASGSTEEEIETARADQERVLNAVATGEGWEEIEEETRQLLRDTIAELPESERAVITDVDTNVDTITNEQMNAVRSRWFKSFFEHDPGPVLEQLTIPVLALFGALDTQTPPDTNSAAISDALTTAGNEDFIVLTLPQANHLFQLAVTGSPQEYAELGKEFVPGFLDRIEAWISSRVDKQ